MDYPQEMVAVVETGELTQPVPWSVGKGTEIQRGTPIAMGHKAQAVSEAWPLFNMLRLRTVTTVPSTW